MASRTPAGGAGSGASAESENEEGSWKSIYDSEGNILEQYDVTFKVINQIYADIPELNKVSADGHVHSLFYLKGGNSLPFLKLPYPVHKTTTSIPDKFPSDFDFTVAINPNLHIDEYNNLLLTFIIRILGSITGTIKEHCRDKRNTSLKQCIRVHKYKSFVGPIHQDLEGLIDKLPTHDDFQCPDTCPFSIYVYKNVTIKNSPRNMGLITLQYRLPTGKSINLLDISYFMRSPHKKIPITIAIDTKLRLDWEITGLVHYEFTKPMDLTIAVYDPLTAYIDMRIAAQTNVRENKRRKRTRRANKLRNEIINPNWRTRELRRTRKNALPNNLKPILNNIDNVSTKNHLNSLSINTIRLLYNKLAKRTPLLHTT